MNTLRAVNSMIEQVFMLIAGSLFAVFIATIFYQVLARNWLVISVGWTDEIALMCFVWSVFLGAAVALRRRVHYVVEILPDTWVNSTNALRLFGALACIPVIYVLVFNGYILTGMGWRRASVALRLPLAWIFMSIPVAGVAMALFSVEVILDDIRRFRSGQPAEHPPEDL
ncbi:TRAP transporter small permease [Roseinatronobacter alkalisoli]|uniref:TRAP transporter small permease protein n=1 Tax=Roseinatronobacter alkalisoli TaxID=3028235 RepID=A0ABT5TB54_9RHOB|nr:TRAP transporter small permease [Roseinatronobacter sp. HJB301]MDD7972358.1 TRAP transporter small permease [Roseinatronobacter sp. HJB301]